MSISAHSEKFAAPTLDTGKKPLIGLDREEICTAVEEAGLAKFRGKQIYHWIYQKGAKSFEEMANLGKADIQKLEDSFTIARPKIVTDQKSQDGTHKWLLSMADGQQIEAVFIPEEDRGALCVSSQVGCTLTCKFCHTGTQPLVRNLGSREILSQIMHTRDYLNEWPSSAPEKRLFTNIVMMGMGEPLYNYQNVAKALKIAMDGEGLSIGRRKITLSTSGVIPEIYKCGEELGVNLAISLHAVTNELRSQIMPINNKYPLEELLKACREYPAASASRKITFEYVMLKGVNDTMADARQLVRILRGIHAKVNLIPFNDWPDSGFECSDLSTIKNFAKVLEEAGFESPMRKPRGRDILAACGQLKSASKRAKKRVE
ncbi:MAG: 23S rRNA (adenine(2503)-C(2))-methyltransferase RlmN [Micavibrio sp.]|nr:23S rRNA (adenine(2503)-C(2))-methyltransferase RlmN [Micavibrio sp.]|tara:strand:- start:1149 stop:2270 length:1122 start_codon:yes stop_codon:yes gene_type:complete